MLKGDIYGEGILNRGIEIFCGSGECQFVKFDLFTYVKDKDLMK